MKHTLTLLLPVLLWERWHIDKPFADCQGESRNPDPGVKSNIQQLKKDEMLNTIELFNPVPFFQIVPGAEKLNLAGFAMRRLWGRG